MKGTPQDCMDVGFSYCTVFPESSAATDAAWEALLRDDYFQAGEVTHIADAAARGRAIACARAAGRATVFSAVPVLQAASSDLGAETPPARQAALDAAHQAMRESLEWGAKGLIVAGGPQPAEERRALVRAMLIASLKELCEFARRSGELPILLEPDLAPTRLIRAALDAADIADQVYPYYRFCGLALSPESLVLSGEGREGSLVIVKEYLRVARLRITLEAASDAVAFLRLLLDAGVLAEGRHTPVILTAAPARGESPQQTAARAKAFLDAAWAAL